ncbi:metallothionein [Nitrosococcus wardiae]|nr:metallothionein [Nitrosococcus wardiae]
MKCAYDSCLCVVTAEQAVKKNERLYCSEACARGQGCEHEQCSCSSSQRDT